LHSEKVDEFYGEGIQRISVIVARWPSGDNIIPKKAAGMDNHTQHHGDGPDEVQTVISLLILHAQNLNELETLIL